MQTELVDAETRQALLRLATLMDEDNARTNHVGIPVSYGHYLVSVAVSGTTQQWDAEWLRILQAQGMQAAKDWSDEQDKREHALIDLVYPGGATAKDRSADEIRALAAGTNPEQEI